MSKGLKTVLIVLGILAGLAVVCAGGIGIIAYLFVDREGFENARKDGAEFGKTTDNAGCQTKSLEMAKTVTMTDITGQVKMEWFNEGCLFASRPTPGFCDGMPGVQKDIWNSDRTKDAECERLGLKDSPACRSAMIAKLRYCETKR